MRDILLLRRKNLQCYHHANAFEFHLNEKEDEVIELKQIEIWQME